MIFSFLFFLFGPLILSNLIIIIIIINLNDLKCYRSATWSYTKSCSNLNTNRATYKEVSGCTGISFFSVWWFVFFSFWLPLLWRVVTFSFVILFGPFLVCQMSQEEEFKFCWDTRNNRALTLEWLSVQSLA
jgi:hypothetical protein